MERNIRTANIPYLPKVKFGSAQGYYDKLNPAELPLYQGEMYLEKHRATYTSQSNNKNSNREFEEKMLSLEMLLASRGKQGDKPAMDKLWKEGLLYQFHDILPGSSIARVYEETGVAYGDMMQRLEDLAAAEGVSFEAAPNSKLINLRGENVCKIVRSGENYLLYQGSGSLIEPVCYTGGAVSDGIASVETDYYTASFRADGSFDTIVLNETGEILARNANKLRVFIDTGDAWDFEDDYRDQPERYMHLDSSCVRDFGDLTEIRQRYSYENSSLVQTILVHKHLPYIQIDHDVNWRDSGYMLRAEIEPGVWSDVVHNDIQFGYLDRPTIDNDAHEKAQFEICCQKWFDISEENRGLAVLNNAKNGFMAKNGIISLNLLRSTDYPCVKGDQTLTHYSYAFYPHAGGFDPVKVDDIAEVYGARYLYGDATGQMPAFDNSQIQITAFKPAYDGNGFILRAFERAGKEAEAKLHIPYGYQLVGEVNLLEDAIYPAETTMRFKPFQIRSFRLCKEDV